MQPPRRSVVYKALAWPQRMFILRSQWSCCAVCSLWLPSFQPMSPSVGVIFPITASRARPSVGSTSLGCSALLSSVAHPASKQTLLLFLQSNSWTEITAGKRTTRKMLGTRLTPDKSYHMENQTHCHSACNKQTWQARRFYKNNARNGGCSYDISSHHHTDSLSLLSRWDMHQCLLHNSKEKLVETCSLVLTMHVTPLTTLSLRNISTTHSVSLGKGCESFLNVSDGDTAPQGTSSGRDGESPVPTSK